MRTLKCRRFEYGKLAVSFIVGMVAFTTCSPIARAAEIVVNQTLPSERYSLVDTRAVFTMRQRFWPNGEQIKVFCLSDSTPLHKDFVKSNLNMFPHQLKEGLGQNDLFRDRSSTRSA